MVDNNGDYRAHRTIVYHLMSACNKKINSPVHREGRQAVSQKATSTHYQSQAQEKQGEREMGERK